MIVFPLATILLLLLLRIVERHGIVVILWAPRANISELTVLAIIAIRLRRRILLMVVHIRSLLLVMMMLLLGARIGRR